MGTIVIHAGMPKAGSSAIQGWLLRGARGGETAPGWTPLVASNVDGSVRVDTAADAGRMNSGGIVHLLRDAATTVPSAQAFAAALRDHLTRHDQIVLSGEGLAQAMWTPLPTLLSELDGLARDHEVRVAYYVRPQHTALEAAWRQWGFREQHTPGTYVERRGTQPMRFDYLGTWDQVRELAPLVTMTVRPFRRDLLAGGDVVVDFARHFLGTQLTGGSDDRSDNVGLSLDLTNLLQASEFDDFWSTAHENATFNRIKTVLSTVTVDPSPAALAGRDVLQAWCHERFADRNAALFAHLGCDAAPFVPPVDAAGDLSRLDELWAPPDSPATREAVALLLRRLLRDRPATIPEDATHASEDLRRELAGALAAAAAAAQERDAVRQELTALRSRRVVRALRRVDRFKRSLRSG